MILGKKSKSSNKLRRYLIAFLLMLSVVLTTGTFAYWVGFVEGASSSVAGSITIGYGEVAKTTIEVSPENLSNGSYLVPTNQLDNSLDKAVDEINLEYLLKWAEMNNTSQINGEDVKGYLEYAITYDIYQNNEDTILDKEIYDDVYNLVNINPYDANTYSLYLNADESNRVGFSVSLNEPNSKTDYELIRYSTIIFNLTFFVKLDQSDINYDFYDYSMQDLTDRGVLIYRESEWTSEVGTALNDDNADARIFFPISNDEYTITVNATLSEGYNGGYGILYDTIINEENPASDTGYILQYDRGYDNGKLIVRPRSYGSERNPVWVSDSDVFFPTYKEDSSWWSSNHKIVIEIIRIDENTKQASFYIDDIFIGSDIYNMEVTSSQTYVGFRGWGNYFTEFHSLTVE